MVSGAVPSRSEVPTQRTWDVTSVFPNDEAWEAAIVEVESALPDAERFVGRLGENPSVLADWFDTSESVARTLGKVYVYAGLIHNVDTADDDGTAKTSRARALFGRAVTATAFADPEMLAIGRDTIDSWLSQEPRLAPYHHYFDDLFRQNEHVRSAEVEEVLGLAMDPFGTATSIHGVLADTDLTFQPAVDSNGNRHELAQGSLNALLREGDREVRRTAWENYADAHLAFKNTMAACISTGIKRDVFRARTRRYGSSLEAALAPNNIPVEVFHALLDAFKSNLPTWHRYWAVRRQALGHDDVRPYDVWAPLGGTSPHVPYEEAVDLICDGMAPLGDEYVSVMRSGCLEQRWVDVYPNRGKVSGAYSDGFPGTHPFILMSYTDDVFSLSTLAHELGHSMHSYYTWKNQPMVYTNYSMFVAETASNFNQALVRDHLMKTRTEPEFQLALIEETMSNFHRYFFIMPTLARLELELHEMTEQGKPITADFLINRTSELFSEGYGSEMSFDPERVGITWAEFSHHLYANFYVFQYATGISAANALTHGVVTEGEPATQRYLDFLRAGSSAYPIDALKMAGVDMTTTEPVDRAFAVLASTVDRLDELVKQRQPAG